MPYTKMRRSAAAGLAMSIAIAGSVLLAPASPAASDSTRGVRPAQSTRAVDDGGRHENRKAVRLRPFKGSGTGRGTATVRDDGKITAVADGTQHFTHLGRSTFHNESVCTNPTCTSFIGTTVNVAANGDTLIFLETTLDGVSTFVITGGTGRFQGATGSASTTGSVVSDPQNPLKFSFSFESLGTIVFGDNLS